ncbi:MAG: ribbon-helix-helix domain-containing protein [Thermoleophilia bacterium]|nr:ribbon-helix-helix domain-containing protein [Thermoleophilia bacterium]
MEGSHKSKKILFSLPGDLLAEIDIVAAEEHRSRSDLIREATRRYITDRPGRQRPIDDPGVREAIRSMDRIAKKLHGDWDAAQAIRDTRDSRYGPSDEENNED